MKTFVVMGLLLVSLTVNAKDVVLECTPCSFEDNCDTTYLLLQPGKKLVSRLGDPSNWKTPIILRNYKKRLELGEDLWPSPLPKIDTFTLSIEKSRYSYNTCGGYSGCKVSINRATLAWDKNGLDGQCRVIDEDKWSKRAEETKESSKEFKAWIEENTVTPQI